MSALLFDGADEGLTNELALGLEALFEDVVRAARPVRPAADPQTGEGALRELMSALAAARQERVLVVAANAPRPTPHLWLALTAWPQHDVVMPLPAPGALPPCALVRRAAVIEAARNQLCAGEAGETRIGLTQGEALHGLVAALDVDVIDGADLSALSEVRT